MKRTLRFLFSVLIVVICFTLFSGCSDSNQESVDSETNEQTTNPTIAPIVSVFDGDCGIVASAEIGDSIIGYPEIELTITNTTDKEIAAIQFYSVPYNVYGEEIDSWMTQHRLYTDTPIAAGETITISYSLIEDSVKSVTLYVYSVYFSDQTEWGDREASSSTIRTSAPTIEVTVNS